MMDSSPTPASTDRWPVPHRPRELGVLDTPTSEQVAARWAAWQSAEGHVCVRLVAQDGQGLRPVSYARLTGARLDRDWRRPIARALARRRPAQAGQRWQVWNTAAWEDLPAHPSNPDQVQVTDRSVCLFGLTEPQFRALEAALGLPRGGLGRYKPWSAPDGVHLDGDRFDVDAAVAFARAHGLGYEQTVTTRHQPGSGHAPATRGALNVGTAARQRRSGPPAPAATPLPGFETGRRQERLEYRVIVHPDAPPPVRWDFPVPAGGDPWAAAAAFVVPTRVECRTVVTYTTGWQPAGPATPPR